MAHVDGSAGAEGFLHDVDDLLDQHWLRHAGCEAQRNVSVVVTVFDHLQNPSWRSPSTGLRVVSTCTLKGL